MTENAPKTLEDALKLQITDTKQLENFVNAIDKAEPASIGKNSDDIVNLKKRITEIRTLIEALEKPLNISDEFSINTYLTTLKQRLLSKRNSTISVGEIKRITDEIPGYSAQDPSPSTHARGGGGQHP